MTNEYKEALLKYLTGNIKEESDAGEITGHFEETEEITNNLDDYLYENLSSASTVLGILQSEKYDNYILYGTYRFNGTVYGFLLILDTNYNPIKVIKTYDSGTLLGRFYKLELDEKNQIYGIDYNPDTTKYRFIMLNNVFSTQKPKLRQSYNLPQQVYEMHDFQLTKNPQSADYLIGGTVFSGNVNQPRIVKLTVNVGSENEWKYFTYSDTLLATGGELSNIYAKWDGDEVDFRMCAYTDSQFVVYSRWEDSYIEATLYDLGINWRVVDIYNLNSIVADYDTFYYGVHARVSGQETLQIFEIKNGVQKNIWTYNLDGSSISDNVIECKLKIKNGALFSCNIVPNSNNYNVFAYVYRKNIIDETTYLAENIPIQTLNRFFDVLCNYNMYKYNYQIGNTLYNIKLLYNPTVNFAPHTTGYNNHTDLKPLTMSLYSNNSLVFNRNLYNIITYGSTTVSTIEVPNTMLNETTINDETLIGNHYLKITENNEEINKNIFETLHINIFNKMSMKNLDTNVMFQSGSDRLNNSCNITQDYDNAKCGKIRIDYEDGTNLILNIKFYPLKNYFYTKFALYVEKEISSINFISNDETTIYNTIYPTLEIGKIYSISEDVWIDEKQETDGVLYNGEQVTYDGDNVYY